MKLLGVMEITLDVSGVIERVVSVETLELRRIPIKTSNPPFVSLTGALDTIALIPSTGEVLVPVPVFVPGSVPVAVDRIPISDEVKNIFMI
jgi:hypothetical protein